MLETEMKKLTAALEANTAALLMGGTDAQPGAVLRNHAGVNEIVPNVTPIVAVPTPVTAAVAPPLQPAVPVEITKDQVLRELSAVIQKMGDNGVGVTTLLTTSFGVTNLTALDPSQYDSVIAAARALVV